ncbi:SAM-dependent methyltransferase [Kibdelosporangium phytohabitans]|uniref:Cyclopropane-fatty-acyl-phospholipid synthase n=1 Tax=Kibdelosporangium phytohabitans TaxID=860235 RepID=A0A0N9HV57_9PSEU|nr:cyclopropane-fatty-acyl-phospholipid synthase family protein [Kibdelosporangium phytohabitans]ALG09098.1 cyclopropane-fatty-acyl-phospholipid synthase [Kibdelosporangium phytohabitans]MBE1469703.1 cyclopropane-fatty-acyl-phospholipid synthase [Kibdelosporangium phytohabitans]
MRVAPELVGLVERLLGAKIPVGVLAWDGSRAGSPDGPCVVLNSRRALRHVLWHPGELGLARAYVTGDLDVDGDLAEGLSRFWRLGRSIKPSPRDWAEIVKLAVRLGVIGPRPKPPVAEARLGGRLHTRSRDRAAIAHHYDLSNDFYQLLLDESMAYSSGYWTSGAASLAEAQAAKLDLICQKLDLRPGMRLLDVGCGWGSLVVHAAKHYGVHATGITLSAQQREHVLKRAEGLTVDVRLQDYRELADEPFDAVASIEMGEHVGEENYPTYAATLYRMLKPSGRLVLQQMSRGAVAPGGGAFIETYIAPDMTMRPIGSTLNHLAAAGFEIRDVHAMREHYVTTCHAWAETLEKRWDEAVKLVGQEQARIWRLYMAGGALAFAENRMGVDQVVAVRTTVDGRSGMPSVREQLTSVVD